MIRKCIHLNHHLDLPFPRTSLASSSFFSFLFAVRLFPPHLRRHALCSHDVTHVGITHRHEVYQGVRMCQDRREGRDSFEPRLVFASPCVPRTSYFNEIVCLSAALLLSLIFFLSCSFFLLRTSFLCSFPLTISLVNQPTDRPVGLSFRTISSRIISSFSYSHASISPGYACFFPPPVLVRLSKKALHRLRIRRTA